MPGSPRIRRTQTAEKRQRRRRPPGMTAPGTHRYRRKTTPGRSRYRRAVTRKKGRILRKIMLVKDRHRKTATQKKDKIQRKILPEKDRRRKAATREKDRILRKVTAPGRKRSADRHKCRRVRPRQIRSTVQGLAGRQMIPQRRVW